MAGHEPARTAARRIRSAIFAPLVFVSATLIVVVTGQLVVRSLASSSADGAVRRSLTVLDNKRPAVATLDPGLLGVFRQATTDAAKDAVEILVNSGWRSPEHQVVLATASQTISTPAPVDVLNIRVYADRDTGKTLTRDATTFTERLLAAAGVATRWRFCPIPAECPREAEAQEPVVVILSSSPRQGSHPPCGFAVHEARAIGTVVISIPCIAESTARIVARADTSLPMIRRHDDVVGAVTAHEIGHLLGLPHADAGLMAPHLGPAEIVDLRLGRLHFTEPEAAVMRTAVSRAMQAAALSGRRD